MPRLLSEQVVQFEFDDLLRRRQLCAPIRRPGQPSARALGAHQSTILAYIARKIGVLKTGERDEGEYPLLWGLGCAWEEWVCSFYTGMEWQPGELTVDGVSVNADGVTAETYWGTLLEECKFTYKSEATGEEFITDKKFWMWQHQARAYCHCYGPRIVRWHVCFVRGNYHDFGPVYKQYVVEFTGAEVAQTWSMLLKNKDAAMAEAPLHT